MKLKDAFSWPEARASLDSRYALLALLGFGLYILERVLRFTPAGFTPRELQLLASVEGASIAGVIIPSDILYLPYTILIANAPFDDAWVLRGFSAIIALLSLIGLYYLLKQWFGHYYALVGALLGAGSTIFLGLSTHVGPFSLILLYMSLSLLAMTWFYRGVGKGYLLASITIPLSVYLGLIGWVVGLTQLGIMVYVLYKKRLKRPGRAVAITSSLLIIIGCIPAFYLALYGSATTAFSSLSLPSISDAAQTGLGLFYGSYENNLYLPFSWPLFDMASLALIALGVTVAVKRKKADRYKLLLGLVVFALAVVVLKSASPESLALAFVPFMLAMTAGLRYLNSTWDDVFPRNIVARVITATVTVCIVTSIISFHFLRYTYLLPQLPTYHQHFKTALQSNQMLTENN